MKAERSSFTFGPIPDHLRGVAVASLLATCLLAHGRAQTGYAQTDSTIPLPPSQVVANDADVSARDVELKNVEEQLLKQLSLGAKPTAQETAGTTMPDIKHVEAKNVEVNPVVAQPIVPAAPAEVKPAATHTAATQPPPAAPVYEPGLREPRTVSIVPISAETAPARPAPRRAKASNSTSSSKDLEQRVTVAESQVTILSKELEDAQRKLADTENRLARAERTMSPNGISAADSDYRSSSYQTFTVPSADSAPEEEITPSVNQLPVARITKDRTPLRIGPGSNQASLHNLSRNSVVEIEHRTGTWYRVISSSGARGWVSGTVLIFDVDNFPGSTDRVMAYQPSREPTGIKY